MTPAARLRKARRVLAQLLAIKDEDRLPFDWYALLWWEERVLLLERKVAKTL